MTMVEEQQEKYADRIAKLLRKAESTTPEEAEALLSKAAELMTLYAIDEQMIAKATGKKLQEKIIELRLEYTGIFQQTLMHIGFALARFKDCRAFFSEQKYSTPKKTTVHVFGFESDVEVVKLLAASLEIQATRAMIAWRKTCDMSTEHTAWDKAQNRRQFLRGFNDGLISRLLEAKRLGQQEASDSEAKRSKVAASQASQSVALVLRSRKREVDDWFDTEFGGGLRSVRRNYKQGSRDANAAGHAAGGRADIGSPGVGGSRGSLNK